MEQGSYVSWEDVLGSASLKGDLGISGSHAHLLKLQLTQ